MKKLIDVYPYRLANGHPEFLIMKRSAGKIYASQWRMIGGKLKKGEKYWEAALRELQEETGLKPIQFWVIPSVNQFYEATSDSIYSIPAFGAELAHDAQIKLDDEHSEFKWVSMEKAGAFILWPEQRRLMQLIHDILTDQLLEILPEWRIQI
ncbi:MAG: NUDIX pyrophosphatase [Balneolaceae bacterium]